jgi:hypothetical protein
VRRVSGHGGVRPTVSHPETDVLQGSTTTMSIDDLANLADALAFALLVTVGGAISWALAHELSRRPVLRREARAALPGAALLAVVLAGGAIRSTVGDAHVVVNAVEGPARTPPAKPVPGSREHPPLALTLRSEGGTQGGPAEPVGADGSVSLSVLGGSGGASGPVGEDLGAGSSPGTDITLGPSPSPVGQPGDPAVDPPDSHDEEEEGAPGSVGEEPPGHEGEEPPGHEGDGPPGHDGEEPVVTPRVSSSRSETPAL